jgi:hypothetical protein
MVISTKIFSIGDSVIALKNPERVMVVIGIEKNLIHCSWKSDEGITRTHKYKREELEKDKHYNPKNIL